MPRTQIDRIDGLTTSVAVKAPCHCATTAAITLSGLQTIDGFGLTDHAPPMRVLVKDQGDSTTNGIYTVNTNAWERALDFDGERDCRNGTLVWVAHGDTNEGLWKAVCADDPVIINESEITFEFVTGETGGRYFEIEHERDDGGSVITTGERGDSYVHWPFEIVGHVIQADQSGSIVFDIWAKEFSDDSPPTISNTITASAKPTLSSQQQKKSSTLTGWTVSFDNANGTALRFNVDSASTITRYKLTLICVRLP